MSTSSEDESSDSSSMESQDHSDNVYEESSLDSSVDSEEENIDVWSRIQDVARYRHTEEYNEMLEKYLANGDTEEIAAIKANNALVPTYRKEFRQVLFEELKWIRYLKKDPIYKKIMETKNNLVIEDYDWEEAMESAISRRKYLLNNFFVISDVPKQKSERFQPYKRLYRTVR